MGEVYGRVGRKYMRVFVCDKGGLGLDEYISFIDKISGESVNFWWEDMRDIMQELRVKDPELFRRLTEE